MYHSIPVQEDSMVSVSQRIALVHKIGIDWRREEDRIVRWSEEMQEI